MKKTRIIFIAISICVSLLTACKKTDDAATNTSENGKQSTGITEEVSIQSETSKEDLKDRQDCPLDELFDYLEEQGAGIPYAYAQIFITVTDGNEEKTKDLDYWNRQDLVDMEGVADILWQSFQTTEEFQEYFSIQEKEEGTLSEKEEENVIEFAYYQYQLEEDTYAIDIDRFLQEHYNEEDNPIYAITECGQRKPNSYRFSQTGMREMVVLDHVIYGLEYKGAIDGIKEDDRNALLMTFSRKKQDVKAMFYQGWIMDEEEIYWIDHDERVISLENPTRVFTEVKGIDITWNGTMYMENFAMFKEADYQIRLYKDGPMLQLHFKFAGEIPPNGYEAYLSNGFCTAEDYEMTITNLDTDELLQSQTVRMSIEMPDMITFVDLDADGYLDMQIDKPTHWSGARAEVDEFADRSFMLWNAEEEVFEWKSETEVAQRLRQNQGEDERQEDTEFVEYVVQPGDTLWGISRRFYGTGTRYMEIVEYNAGVLSGYEYLMPGMVLKIQAPIRLP